MEHTKVIYSLRLMNFLVECGCELLEIRQHPHIKKYKCFVFVDDELLQRSIGEFMIMNKKS